MQQRRTTCRTCVSVVANRACASIDSILNSRRIRCRHTYNRHDNLFHHYAIYTKHQLLCLKSACLTTWIDEFADHPLPCMNKQSLVYISATRQLQAHKTSIYASHELNDRADSWLDAAQDWSLMRSTNSETPSFRFVQDLYQEACAACHNVDRALGHETNNHKHQY